MADFGLNRITGHDWSASAAIPAFGTFTLNSSDDAVIFYFSLMTTDTITALLTNVASTAGTPGDITLALKDVATDGTQGSTTHASGTVSPTAGIVAATISYAGTFGQKVCLVISCAGAGASDTVTLNVRATNQTATNYPTLATITDGGAQSKVTNPQPIYGYRTASRGYGAPVQSWESADYASTTERGIRFTPTAGWGSTYTVAGICFGERGVAAANTITINLYTDGNASTAASSTGTLDSDQLTQAAANNQSLYLPFEGTLTTIASGQPAFIGVIPSTNMRYYVAVFATEGDAKAWGGDIFSYINRTASTNAFTVDATRVPLIDVILTDWGGQRAFVG